MIIISAATAASLVIAPALFQVVGLNVKAKVKLKVAGLPILQLFLSKSTMPFPSLSKYYMFDPSNRAKYIFFQFPRAHTWVSTT